MATWSSSASTSEGSCWLVKDEHVLASAEVASTSMRRARGLIGRDGIDGVMVLLGVKSVHSFGMRFDLDVAFVDRDGVVLRIVRLPRRRMTRVVWRSHAVIEGRDGCFQRWGLDVGDRVELR